MCLDKSITGIPNGHNNKIKYKTNKIFFKAKNSIMFYMGPLSDSNRGRPLYKNGALAN